MYFCKFCLTKFKNLCTDENCPKCGKPNPSFVSRKRFEFLAIEKMNSDMLKVIKKYVHMVSYLK